MSVSERLSDPEPLVLSSLPLFDLISPELRPLLTRSFVRLHFPFGAAIVREGEAASAMYVLVAGEARALKSGEHGAEIPLNLLGPGDSFGEEDMVGSLQSLTVRASSEVEVLRLDGGLFRALLQSEPRLRAAVEAQAKRRTLSDFFRVHGAFARLPPDGLEILLSEVESVEAAKGALVIREGDPPAAVFVVEQGHLRLFRGQPSDHHDVAFVRAGDFVGDRSLLLNAPADATVEAASDAILLRLDRATFHKLLELYPRFHDEIEERAAQYDYRRLARVPLDFADEILSSDGGSLGPAEPISGVASPNVGDGAGNEESIADGWVAGSARSRRIRGFPHVWGIDEMDCGAASLAMICRYFGRRVSLAHIRDVALVGLDGASLAGICAGAQALGIDAKAVKISDSRLHEMPLPAICHWEGNHWLVVYDVGRTAVRVSDPMGGHKRIARAEFEQKWTGFAALVRATPALAKAPEEGSRIGWIWPFFRPYRRTLAAAAVLALASAGAEMLIPVFAQVVVDRVILPGEPSLLMPLLVAMLGIVAVVALVNTAQRYLLARIAVRFDTSSLDTLTARLLVLPMQYFHTRRTLDISRRLQGLRWAREFIVQKGVLALTAITQLVVAVGLMFVYSPPLALTFVAVAPVYAGLMRYASVRLQPMYNTVEESFAKYNASQIDSIKGIETVKSMSAEEAFRTRLLAQFRGLAEKLFRADLLLMLYSASIQVLTLLTFAVFLWLGAQQVLAGQMSLGGLVSFNALVLLANGPISALLTTWDEFQYSAVLLNRLNDVLAREPEQGADRSRLRGVPTLEGALSLRGVGFQYPGPASKPVLQDITLDVEPGMTVAVVGRSGSGKTTLARCLAGLLEPTSGTISYDGVELRQLDYRQLRRHIGFVLQDTYLFDDTIARNIAFGDAEPDEERVEQAARLAAAHDFILRFPLGYQTRVGETGLLVSGGQRQRIAIARALYNRPAVLVLDEATSSLDSEAERAIQENLSDLIEERTSIVIAHRISTVRNADLIVVIERGRLVERGTHDELMPRRGLYFYLVSQQLEL